MPSSSSSQSNVEIQDIGENEPKNNSNCISDELAALEGMKVNYFLYALSNYRNQFTITDLLFTSSVWHLTKKIGVSSVSIPQ